MIKVYRVLKKLSGIKLPTTYFEEELKLFINIKKLYLTSFYKELTIYTT